MYIVVTIILADYLLCMRIIEEHVLNFVPCICQAQYNDANGTYLEKKHVAGDWGRFCFNPRTSSNPLLGEAVKVWATAAFPEVSAPGF